MHVTLETAQKYRVSRHALMIGLCDVEGFPLVHLMARFALGDEDRLQTDWLLNVFISQHELGQLKAFTWQDEILFYWYDENLKFVRSSVAVWSDDNRSDAGRILEMVQKRWSLPIETGSRRQAVGFIR